MAEHTRPRQQVFDVSELPTKRVGYCGAILEDLKELASEGRGLKLEFATRAQGSNATKRLATMAAEDGYEIRQQLATVGASRYVWAAKVEGEPEYSGTEESDDEVDD